MGPFITSLLSISRLRADLVTAGIDPGRAPFEHRSRAHGVAVFLLTT